MDAIAVEAARLAQHYTAGSLSYALIFSVLKRIEADAYAKGLRTAAKPMVALSDELDRRMAVLAASEVGNAGHEEITA